MKPGNLLEQGTDVTKMGFEAPEQQPEVRFDPERDLTPEDWQGMEERLERYHTGKHWSVVSSLASNLRTIDPTRDLHLGTAAWKGMDELLAHYRENPMGKDWDKCLTLASQMHIIDPTHDLLLDTSAWKAMEKELENNRVSGLWEFFAYKASKMRTLDPTRDLHLDEEAWKGMEARLEKFRKYEYWSMTATLASSMHIIDPTRDLHLNEDDWQGMEKSLQSFRGTTRKGSWDDFIAMASLMRILSEQPKASQEPTDTPPLPEVKNF